MPSHKVSAAANKIADLKDSLKGDTVLQGGSSLISAALSSKEESIAVLAGLFKDFQTSHNADIRRGADEGERLAKGLMEHAREE